MFRKSLIPVFVLMWATSWRSANGEDDTGLVRLDPPPAPAAAAAAAAGDGDVEDNAEAALVDPVETPFDNMVVYPWFVSDAPTSRAEGAVRFGWWAVDQNGNKIKVGEYQELRNSPFWNVDTVISDGERSVDFTGSGLDNEANSARLRFYDPNLSANVEYDRFLRRWDHDPLAGPQFQSLTASGVGVEDLNVGEDYAVRVQELKASVKGDLGKDVKWRVNLWGLRKTGERQTTAIGHCFTATTAASTPDTVNTCHVLSQKQRIDWLTMEVEPVIDARFGAVNVQYARTMRTFGQSDQIVTREHTRYLDPYGTATNAIVPESFTQIDRLKINSEVADDTHLYASFFNGDTHNDFRKTDRSFNGIDVRLSNESVDGLNVTVYAKSTRQDNQNPDSLLIEEDPSDLRHPINYARFRTGITTRWRPFYDQHSYGPQFDPWRTFAVTSGYEYYELARDYAVWDVTNGPVSQGDTRRHQIRFGPSMKLSPELNTFVRYQGRFIADPLFGVAKGRNALPPRVNSSQPEQEHGVDFGASWNPASNLTATAQFSAVSRWNNSAPLNQIDYQETSFPIVTTLWFAPTDKLSLTGGYAYFSNWIDQEVNVSYTGRIGEAEALQTDYDGTNQVVSFNANYACSEDFRLVGGIEWNRGNNSFRLADPLTFAGDYSQVAGFSSVLVETTRFNAGFDHQLSPGIASYFRYNYFDYNDETAAYNSGTAHFFLAGLSATY